MAKLIGESGTPPDGARVFLRMENITARKLGAGAVEVHLNVPEGASPRDFRDRRVGEVPMFGVKEASRRSDAHSGSGLTVTLEITQVVRALAAASQWDPATMRVTFTPVPDASGRVPEGDVVVGRVSLFYA